MDLILKVLLAISLSIFNRVPASPHKRPKIPLNKISESAEPVNSTIVKANQELTVLVTANSKETKYLRPKLRDHKKKEMRP